jgi:hypothetical protein
MPDRDLRDVAERIVDFPQLRHVLDGGIVERQQAAIAQLHDRDAREGLGDRRPVINRLFVHAGLRREILIALECPVGDLAVLHEHEAAPGDACLLHPIVIDRRDPRPRVARRRVLQSERGERREEGKEPNHERIVGDDREKP